jgi:transcriptional regulator with XRE-family HTH domain
MFLSFLSARLKAGLSQAAVAKELGIAAASVCQWETGKTLPDPRRLPKVAALYGCSVDCLLSDNPDSTVPETQSDKTDGSGRKENVR